MNQKEVIQEKIKNNWELAKTLSIFSNAAFVIGLVVGIGWLDLPGHTRAVIITGGFVISVAGQVFAFITYKRNLRLLKEGKEN